MPWDWTKPRGTFAARVCPTEEPGARPGPSVRPVGTPQLSEAVNRWMRVQASSSSASEVA